MCCEDVRIYGPVTKIRTVSIFCTNREWRRPHHPGSDVLQPFTQRTRIGEKAVWQTPTGTHTTAYSLSLARSLPLTLSLALIFLGYGTVLVSWSTDAREMEKDKKSETKKNGHNAERTIANK